jgi:hypothetical protein
MRTSGSSARSALLAASALAAASAPAAQTLPDIETVLTRVGERIADYYKRAQNVVCTEKQTVQPVGHDFSPAGFARVTEYELRIETDSDGDGDGDGTSAPAATVVRKLLKINGRPPRERDKKDRAGCSDANPLSPEPLEFLLPAHRSEYKFVLAGPGQGKDRNTWIIEFSSPKPPKEKGEIAEDPRGIPDCFSWNLPIGMKGRVWIDPESYNVLRVEQRIVGLGDISVPYKLALKHNLQDRVIVERHDKTIRYHVVPFHDPEDSMLLPASIESLTMVRGGFESTRSQQTFTDYRRFVTGARVVR